MWKETLGIITLIVIISIPLGFALQRKAIRQAKAIRDQGAWARAAGADASANPYVNDFGDKTRAVLWLDGWLGEPKASD